MKSAELLPYQDVCEQLLAKASNIHMGIPNSHFCPTYRDGRGGATEDPKWTSGVLREDPSLYGEDSVISLNLTGVMSPEPGQNGSVTMTGSRLTRAVIESARILKTFDDSEELFGNFKLARYTQEDQGQELAQFGAPVRYAGDNKTVFIAERTHAIGLSQDIISDLGSFLHGHNLLGVYLDEFDTALQRVSRAIGHTAALIE